MMLRFKHLQGQGWFWLSGWWRGCAIWVGPFETLGQAETSKRRWGNDPS